MLGFVRQCRDHAVAVAHVVVQGSIHNHWNRNKATMRSSLPRGA